jgi:hypothetical protein
VSSSGTLGSETSRSSQTSTLFRSFSSCVAAGSAVPYSCETNSWRWKAGPLYTKIRIQNGSFHDIGCSAFITWGREQKQTGSGVLHNVEQKMISGVLWSKAYLKTGIMLSNLVEVSHVEFQQSLWKALWGTWKHSSMTSCKLFFFYLLWISMDGNRNFPTTSKGVSHIKF